MLSIDLHRSLRSLTVTIRLIGLIGRCTSPLFSLIAPLTQAVKHLFSSLTLVLALHTSLSMPKGTMSPHKVTKTKTFAGYVPYPHL